MFESAITTAEWLMAGLAALVAAMVIVTYVPAILIKRAQRRSLIKACAGKLVLTYDDGPDPLLTPRLIELLRRHHVRATFFLLGFRAERSPDMCDLLVKSGHELGCHSQRHLDSHLLLPWRAISNMKEGYATMHRWMDESAPYRPPYGKLTTWLWLALRIRGAPVHWWTVDGCDTHATLPNPHQVAQRIVASGGAVVLLHSHDRGLDRQEYVLTLTEELLIAAKQAGLQNCTMKELARPTFPPLEK